ncbi:unnamed protein product [Lathyrus sativus]|nr:unnamed protein product [Lathyrus sativus]
MNKHLTTVVAGKNEKVNLRKELHIHDDIAFSILSKLCLKSLKRFECVCKSWSLLLDKPNFMTMYRKVFLTKEDPYYDDASLLIYGGKFTHSEVSYLNKAFELYSVSGDRFENRVKLRWPCTSDFDFYSRVNYDIIGSGSVNGILCLRRAFSCYYYKKLFIVWNPSTEECKLIPVSLLDNISSVSYSGFGYDSRRDDYKLMCLREEFKQVQGTYSSKHYTWEIYCLRKKYWRELDLTLHHISKNSCEQLYMDGLSHWMCESVTQNETYMLSFDWSNEFFITTHIDDNFDFHLVSRHLVLLNGSIALILNLTKTTTFHILVSGELSVKESWTKMFIVDAIPFPVYPIGAGRNSVWCSEKKTTTGD